MGSDFEQSINMYLKRAFDNWDTETFMAQQTLYIASGVARAPQAPRPRRGGGGQTD